MNFLVDTHYLIWSLLEPAKMLPGHRAILLDPRSTKYVSKVSYWEIALKYQLGKLQLKGISPEALMEAALQAGFETFDISEDDLISSYQLPASTIHRDPFDRLLVWQCIRNNLTFISVDKRLKEYTQHGLKLAKTK